MSKVFLDTNVLAYCLDNADRSRRTKARELLAAAATKGQTVISTQVLRESYVAAESAHRDVLWTEDLNDGQVIRGVTVRNPFKH
jgi:predicted nucleic acid-binding protein